MLFQDIFGNLFHYVHVSVIHFPLATLSLASIFGILNFLLVILRKIHTSTKKVDSEKLERSIQVFEIVTVINLLIGLLSIPFVALMGFIDAGTVEYAVTTDLLAFKIQLTIVGSFILLVPLIYKLYLMKKTDVKIFDESIWKPIFYLAPLLLGTSLILLVAGAGGRYVFGHSILDNVGLGFLIPDKFDYTFYYKHYPISFIADKMTQPIGILITLIILLVLIIIPFRRKTKNSIDV